MARRSWSAADVAPLGVALACAAAADGSDEQTFELPWPPTVNTMWRRVGARTLLSERGRRYKRAVALLLQAAGVRPLAGEVAVEIVAHPPDRRVRDLDNLLKAPLDAMAHVAYADDALVRRLSIEAGEVRSGGALLVTVRSWARGVERAGSGA